MSLPASLINAINSLSGDVLGEIQPLNPFGSNVGILSYPGSNSGSSTSGTSGQLPTIPEVHIPSANLPAVNLPGFTVPGFNFSGLKLPDWFKAIAQNLPQLGFYLLFAVILMIGFLGLVLEPSDVQQAVGAGKKAVLAG